MDFEDYRRRYFVQPAPPPRFGLRGIRGAALYYQEYAGALAFYTGVFGPPAYVEGENTQAWKLGDTWLTLFPAREGGPMNVEVLLYLDSAEELDRLYSALTSAGAKGEPPADTLMFAPVRMTVLKDPFGGMLTLVWERPAVRDS